MKEKRLITFSSAALKWLKTRASKLDISVSELVRRIIDAEREKGSTR